MANKATRASIGPRPGPARSGSKPKAGPTNDTTYNLENIGPTEAGSPTNNPPNRSDQIFYGLPLPVIAPQDQVQRRDFTIPIRPTLHYRDGLDGAAETVTVKERRFFKDPNVGEGESSQSHYVKGTDDTDDHGEFGADPGQDPNKYAEDPNTAYTLNGQWIRGT